MAKLQSEESKEVQVKRPNSIFQELTELHETISKRAYEFFQESGLLSGPLADWFRAERELVWRPPIELRQKDGQFELEVALAGVEPKNLDVQVTPEDILITAAEEHRHEGKEGTVHVCEFSSGRLFRSVHLPDRVDPESVKAEFKNGMLRLTAAVAKTATKKVDVQAA
jgi:HSP20 family molecular chaperone IbpA